GDHRWRYILSTVWDPTGNDILISATLDVVPFQYQLWEVSYSSGEVRRLTNDSDTYASVSASSDGKLLVTTQFSETSGIWKWTPTQPASLDALTPTAPGSKYGEYGLDTTVDGKILYTYIQEGVSQIWVMNADGSNRKPLATQAGLVSL